MTTTEITAYGRLKDHAVHYRFRPGEHLHVCELATRLRVSATPVRETLTKLCAEALVTFVQSRGFFAKTLATEEMRALFEFAFLILRCAIEGNVAAFSPGGISTPVNPAFDRDGRMIGDSGGFCRSHALFVEDIYERIALLSGNSVMVDTIRSFNERTRYVRLIGFEIEQDIPVPANGTYALLAALANHDAPRAVAVLRCQLEKNLEGMGRIVSEGLARSRAGSAFGPAFF